MLKKIFFFQLLIFLYNIPAIGQDQKNSVIDSLIQKVKYQNLSISSKNEIYHQINRLAMANNYEEGIWFSEIRLANALMISGDFVKAYQYIELSEISAYKFDNMAYKAESAYYFGSILVKLGDYQGALHKYFQAHDFYLQITDTAGTSMSLNAIGMAYFKGGEPDSSLHYLNLAIKYSYKDEYLQSYPLQNIASIYLTLEKPDSALVLLYKVLNTSYKHENLSLKAVCHANIGWAYKLKKNYHFAVAHIDSSIDYSLAAKSYYTLYEYYHDQAMVYDEMNVSDSAIVYYKKYNELKDSIYYDNLGTKIAQLQIANTTLKSDHKIALIQNKNKTLHNQSLLIKSKNRTILVGVISGSIFALILIFKILNNHKKKRVLLIKDKHILEIEIDLNKSRYKNQKLAQAQLLEKLAFKEKDLTNFALDISRKKEFNEWVHRRLKNILALPQEEYDRQIKVLMLELSQQINENDKVNEFQKNIEVVNTEFFNRLSTQYPNLSQTDLSLCGFVRLNLSIKNIALIKNISPKSVEMARYRLRKKLNISTGTELSKFLESF